MLTTGNFNISFNDGGTLTLISLMKDIRQQEYRSGVVHFWDKDCNWEYIQKKIASFPDVSNVESQIDYFSFRLFDLQFLFVHSPYPVYQLYSQRNDGIKDHFIRYITGYLEQIQPKLIFTVQLDIFSLQAAREYRVYHFIRSMEPIEFQFRFPYKQELQDALQAIPISVSSAFLQSELRRAYGVEAFILYPVIEARPLSTQPKPHVRLQDKWITLINFSMQKGGYLFFLVSCLFKDNRFVAFSGNKRLFNSLKQPSNENLYYVDPTRRMDRVYPMIKILMAPSIVKDACPRVIFEAMSYSIPILANRIGGIPEIIQDHESLIDIHDRDANEVVQDYALRLRRLLTEPDYYQSRCALSIQTWLKWRIVLEENKESFFHWAGLK